MIQTEAETLTESAAMLSCRIRHLVRLPIPDAGGKEVVVVVVLGEC